MSYKVGIIGAARRHQGTGPYIARTFHNLGHQVVAILGTSDASANNAAAHLKEQFGMEPQGYTNFDDLVDQHHPDILVISSPPDSHIEYLKQALINDMHVFCEKPFWWPNQSDTMPDLKTYKQIIHACTGLAVQKNKLIHLNTQWPYTLRDFMHLHPTALTGDPIHQFAMHLCPQSK